MTALAPILRSASRPGDKECPERTYQRTCSKPSYLHLKPSERDPILYLEEIALSMQRVKEYTSGLDFLHFQMDYKTVDAVIRNF